MGMDSHTDKAKLLSQEIHAHQVHQECMDYVGHPLRVARIVQTQPGFTLLPALEQEAVFCVAYVHDVIKASPEKPCGAVTAEGFLARLVKLADIANNRNHHRYELLRAQGITPKTRSIFIQCRSLVSPRKSRSGWKAQQG